jgi:hypothetical protein
LADKLTIGDTKTLPNKTHNRQPDGKLKRLALLDRPDTPHDAIKTETNTVARPEALYFKIFVRLAMVVKTVIFIKPRRLLSKLGLSD